MGKNVFGNTIFNNRFADNHKIILPDLVQHGFINYLGNITEVTNSLLKKGY